MPIDNAPTQDTDAAGKTELIPEAKNMMSTEKSDRETMYDTIEAARMKELKEEMGDEFDDMELKEPVSEEEEVTATEVEVEPVVAEETPTEELISVKLTELKNKSAKKIS